MRHCNSNHKLMKYIFFCLFYLCMLYWLYMYIFLVPIKHILSYTILYNVSETSTTEHNWAQRKSVWTTIHTLAGASWSKSMRLPYGLGCPSTETKTRKEVELLVPALAGTNGNGEIKAYTFKATRRTKQQVKQTKWGTGELELHYQGKPPTSTSS